MSNSHSIVCLSLIIAALGMANYLLRDSAGGKGVPTARTTLVPPLYDAVGIDIQRHGSPTAKLVKEREWRLREPYESAVDEPAVKKLLDRICQSAVLDVIQDSELLRLGRRRADFRLGDPLVKLRITAASGQAVEMEFGAPTPTGDGVYVAIGGERKICVVPMELLSDVDVTADSFRRRKLFRIAPEEVASFGVRCGEPKPIEVVRAAGGWTANGVKADTKMVDEFLNQITSLEAVDFVWPTGGSNETSHVAASFLAACEIDPEHAVGVLLRGIDGVERKVLFGKGFDGGNVYALVNNSAAVVTVPAAVRDSVLKNPAKFTDTRLFPLELSAINAFTVVDGEVACSLARNSDGGWRLEAPVVAAANPAVVAEVLKRISVLSAADVAMNGVGVSVTTNGKPVMVSRTRVLGDGKIEDFRSREVLNIGADLVKRLVRTSAEDGRKPESVVFNRERRTWTVETAEGKSGVDEGGVKSVLAAISPLTAERVVKLKVSASDLDDFGLDHPFLTVAVDSDVDDAVRRNIIVGAPTEGGRFVTVGSSDAVFVVSDKLITQLKAAIVH